MRTRWIIHKTFFLILIICSLGANLQAQQESLVGISRNQQLSTGKDKEELKKSYQKLNESHQDTIQLPFIKDFAGSVGYPNPKFWSDNQAFTNHQYAKNPVSIGVVTLDAINSQGDIYKQASSTGFSADTLTSDPIDLDFSAADSIYLSFYYQPGGLGDTPEFKDSLTVQFFNPDSLQWQSIWNVSVYQDSIYVTTDIRKQKTDSILVKNKSFRQANLPVIQEKFLKKGFRFRFINYASITDFSRRPSLTSNVDHWNLDFIRLDTARSYTDTTINDIAFVKPMKPLLNSYEAIPWKHFPEANAVEMDDSIYITYRNIGDKVWNISREFEIIDKMGEEPPYTFTGGTGDDIPPYTKETYPRAIDYIFPENNNDSALFEITSYLVTDTISERAPYRRNDTITYNQKFYNYYAYDDGTAENGYGINGVGSEYAKVALRFHNYKADTLQGLQIFFNQTRDTTRKFFKIIIWKNENGQPGKIIYSETDFKQKFENGINKFHNYSLADKPFLTKGDYFIGYQKFTTEMLNVGFDVNRVNNDKLFYYVDGKWHQSGYKGTVMMRPLMGDYIKPTHEELASVNNKIHKPKVEIYPNPARNYINVELSGNNISKYSARIFSIQGSLVKNIQALNRTIQVGQLTSGTYIIELINKQSKAVIRKKFMVTD
jgi:hypothetical protein